MCSHDNADADADDAAYADAVQVLRDTQWLYPTLRGAALWHNSERRDASFVRDAYAALSRSTLTTVLHTAYDGLVVARDMAVATAASIPPGFF